MLIRELDNSASVVNMLSILSRTPTALVVCLLADRQVLHQQAYSRGDARTSLIYVVENFPPIEDWN